MAHQTTQRFGAGLAAAFAISFGAAASAQHLAITTLDNNVGDGEKLVVTVGLQGGSVAGVGAQLVLHYDTTRLSLDQDATSGASFALVPSSALDMAIYESADPSTGTYIVALGTSTGNGNASLSGGFVTLTFTCLGDFAGVPGLVSFTTSGPFSSMVSNAAQQAVTLGAPANLGGVTHNGAAPSLVSVPANLACWRDAGGTAAATVSITQPTALDTLGHALPVAYTRTDGERNLTTFPVGATTITWSATDSSGNVGTATTTVDVSPDSVAVAELACGGVYGNASFTRGMAIDVTKGGLATDSDVQTVTLARNGAGGLFRASTTARFQVAGGVNWAGGCASVRDPLHTIRRAFAIGTGGGAGTFAGRTYASSYAIDGSAQSRWLLVGNANGDANIDILDYGTFVSQRGQTLAVDTAAGTVGPHTDFSANGPVTNADLTFLAANIFKSDELCTGFTTGGSPIRRISVRELRRLGMGELAVGDLNGDGWLDEKDLAIALQGGAAQRPAGPADASRPVQE